jgi:hypothetical protein
MLNAPAWLIIVMMLPLAACSKAEDKKEPAPPANETEKPKTTEVVAAKPDTATKPETATKPTPSATEVPAKDYLSKSWAMYMNRVPGGDSKTSGSPAEERAAAQALSKEGYALYKAKNDTEAVVKYEAAISRWASADTYYKYGNSLSNIDRLEDSIKAYEIALQLGYAKPEMALYNTACSYSRLENVEPAYDFLAKAIHRGYNAFKFIEKDPDMKFLRSQPDWKKRIEALVPEDVRLGADKLVGTLEVMTPRDPESYTVCANGKLIFDTHIADDGSCCSATHTGTWSLETGDLVVNWKETCSGVGSGEIEHSAGGCDQRAVCSEKICSPYTDVEYAEMILVQREELAAMKKRKTRELFDDGEARVTPFEGAEPDACK